MHRFVEWIRCEKVLWYHMAPLYFTSCFSNYRLLRNPLGCCLCGFSFLQLLTVLIVPHPHLWMALLWFSHFPISFIDVIDLISCSVSLQLTSFLLELNCQLLTSLSTPPLSITQCFSNFNVHGNHLNLEQVPREWWCCLDRRLLLFSRSRMPVTWVTLKSSVLMW